MIKTVEDHFRDKFTADLTALLIPKGSWKMGYLTLIPTNNYELCYKSNRPALYPYMVVYNEKEPLAIKEQFEEVVRFLFKTLPRK
jgi:hypothetical protein